MKGFRKIRNIFGRVAEIIFFIFALAVFCYSGYKIASHFGLLDRKVAGAESCGDCSSCSQDDWQSELCQKIREWCQRLCHCQPTSTPPPVPTPTAVEPTPTTVEPTPTTPVQPTSTPVPEGPTPTVAEFTPTPTSTIHVDGGIGGADGGGGGGGGGPAAPCTPPEAPKTPILLSATAISSTEVKLVWAKVNRATHYVIAYGEESRHYIYGNANVGNTDSYVVGGLTAGKTYYFVVSGAIGGDCPVASPYSSELSARPGARGDVLGLKKDKKEIAEEEKLREELDGGISTQAGEVAGAAKGVCPFWWIVLLGQAIILGAIYGLWLRKNTLPKRWWLFAPAVVVVAYLVDRYAHTHWFTISKMCPWEKWLGIGLASLETVAFKKLRKKSLKGAVPS